MLNDRVVLMTEYVNVRETIFTMLLQQLYFATAET